MAACGLMLGIACHACSAPCDERSALHALSNGQKPWMSEANDGDQNRFLKTDFLQRLRLLARAASYERPLVAMSSNVTMEGWLNKKPMKSLRVWKKRYVREAYRL